MFLTTGLGLSNPSKRLITANLLMAIVLPEMF